jgi:DAACS family dicarboxylate/amino acid:cation (Na+ or H+) symporter
MFKALHSKIFVGMLLGAAAGVIVQLSGASPDTIDTLTSYIKPVGDIFLRMIFMMVIPLLISGLSLGIADLGDLKKIGRIGLTTLLFTIIVTGISVFLGITMAEIFRPGDSLSAADRTVLVEKYSSPSQDIAKSAGSLRSTNIVQTLVNIIPKNPFEDMARAFEPGYLGGGILAIMFFALILGIALSISDHEKTAVFRKFLEGLYEVVMKAIGIAMNLAPIGVAALLFVLTAQLGYSIFAVLLQYVLVVLAALAIHQFITYTLILRFVCKLNPLTFFANIREVMLTAFSTSSSNVTLPVAIRVARDKLKLPKDITNFVLTIGSTANQNGTALYEGITVLFLAQCFGVQLGIGEQIFVVLISVLSGIGTAGVPGGSLPIVMLILISIGLPAESIAIIYGVDRILDMSRTTLNVTGDIVAAAFVTRMESRFQTQPQ